MPATCHPGRVSREELCAATETAGLERGRREAAEQRAQEAEARVREADRRVKVSD